MSALQRILPGVFILGVLCGTKSCCRYVFSPLYEEVTISYGELGKDGTPRCSADRFLVTHTNRGLRTSDYRYVRPIIRRRGHSDNLVQFDCRDDTVLARGQSVSYCDDFKSILPEVKLDEYSSLELDIDIVHWNYRNIVEMHSK